MSKERIPVAVVERVSEAMATERRKAPSARQWRRRLFREAVEALAEEADRSERRVAQDLLDHLAGETEPEQALEDIVFAQRLLRTSGTMRGVLTDPSSQHEPPDGDNESIR